MRSYLVERYAERGRAPSAAELMAAADAGAERARQEGAVAWHLISISLPAEETCLSVYAAASPEDVIAAEESAGLVFDRIVEAAVAGSLVTDRDGRLRSPAEAAELPPTAAPVRRPPAPPS